MVATASSELSGTVSSLDKSVASNAQNEAAAGSIGTESMESSQHPLTGAILTTPGSDRVVANQPITGKDYQILFYQRMFQANPAETI